MIIIISHVNMLSLYRTLQYCAPLPSLSYFESNSSWPEAHNENLKPYNNASSLKPLHLVVVKPSHVIFVTL